MSSEPDPFADDPWLKEKPPSAPRVPKWVMIAVVGCSLMIALLVLAFFASFFIYV